ncbi:MAG: CoA transferase [Chloroflexota bacterium]
MNSKALAGVHVVGFELAQAGPMTTSFLAAYGAEVIRIESQKHLDWHRQIGPFLGDVNNPDRSCCFLHANPGKMSMTLNLKHEHAMKVIRRIISWADVVVDTFAGGVMERLGLGYNDMVKIKPAIIMLSSDTYGHSGPFAGTPSYGVPLTALSGLPHITGAPDQMPQFPGFAITDFIIPRTNVLAIVSALDYRRKTGKGQYIDASQFECTIPLLTPVILELEANGVDAGRIGNHSRYGAPHNVYRCRGEDRWCAISVFTDQEWWSLCEVMSNPALASEPRFATLSHRLENQDELDRIVEAWTMTHPAEEVMETLQNAGIACGVLQTGRDLAGDPQLKYDNFYREIDHPGAGVFSYSGMAANLSRTPYEITRAPNLGEHNEFVCRNVVGLSDEEFVELLGQEAFE